MENISKSLKKPVSSRSRAHFEETMWEQQAYVCGIDEVGRGCFAGPVLTAAVILHPYANSSLLKDSKILTEKNRNKAATWIIEHSWHAYGIVSPADIDRKNIYEATKRAMRQALYGVISQNLGPLPLGMVLIDAVPLFAPGLAPDLKFVAAPFGEQWSISIAAASILAKVKRDQLISRMELPFPGYQFSEHKGYGTAAHQKVLAERGVSLIHRMSYDLGLEKKGEGEKNHEQPPHQQTTLFC